MSQSMFQRRCLLALTRHAVYYSPTFPSLKILPRHLSTLTPSPLDSLSIPTTSHLSLPFCGTHYFSIRHLSSKQRDDKDDEEDVEEMEEGSDEEKDENDGLLASSSAPRREYSAVEEAAEIGYEVIGSLKPSDRVFKMYEPVFAVVQIGSHQFKVSNGDCIFTEKLKFCEVNDKLLLKKVLLLGSQTKTIIGRPIVPDAAVHAVVEEHALDAKVIIFKKKRRKNYRRTKGHRQELTKLRITDIQGIEKPEKTAPSKLVKAPPVKKSPKVQVPLPVVA